MYNFGIYRHRMFLLPFVLLFGPHKCLWWALCEHVCGEKGGGPGQTAVDGQFPCRMNAWSPTGILLLQTGPGGSWPGKKSRLSFGRPLLKANLPPATKKSKQCKSLYSVRLSQRESKRLNRMSNCLCTATICNQPPLAVGLVALSDLPPMGEA